MSETMAATPSTPSTIEDLARAMDAAQADLNDLEPSSRRVAEAALDALNALHKDGLTTIVRTLKADERGRELLFELVDQPEVRMLLAVHGIIRPDPVTAAQQVLAGIRGGLQSHGGDVELDAIRDGVAYVRLQGACNGCSMASVTMREGVEKALIEGVPGITGVEVVPNEPGPTLVPLSSIGIGAPRDLTLRESGWVEAAPAESVPVGELRAMTVRPDDGPALDVILVNAAGQLAAYVNECAHQGRPLDHALVDPIEGTITCPWHGFCYDSATGECLTMPGAQLRQLPLRIESGRAWVRASGL